MRGASQPDKRSACAARHCHRRARVPRSREAPAGPVRTIPGMIYCVVPTELEAELYDKLVEYYKDNPNVTVIIDRREGDRRARAGKSKGNGGGAGKREIRDRRRPRARGTFLTTDR